VADYVRWRPGYPEAVADLLVAEAGLKAGSRVADVGSGTGISSILFLHRGCAVFAVEPNRAMRETAQASLGGDPRFRSVDGRAEATGLPSDSVVLVVVGQAFHWFDPLATRAEFARILVPGGIAALFWNTRLTEETPFLRAYEELLQTHGTDYRAIDHRRVDGAALAAFFAPAAYASASYANAQDLDEQGLRGRLLSSSYVPSAEDPRSGPMLSELSRIFATHQREGRVRLEYRTEVHWGQVGGPAAQGERMRRRTVRRVEPSSRLRQVGAARAADRAQPGE
jgi:SAM-dependent methyltransferase